MNANDVYQLSAEEISMIEEARLEYEMGNTISHEELMEELDKWLKS